jgi:heat shock protein HtpX
LAQTFHDLIAANRRNSVFLVIAFVILIALTVYAFSTLLWGGDLRTGLAPALIALVAAGLMSIWAIYGGARAILGMSRAREIRKDDDPRLWNVVEELTIAAGIPMPKVYLIDDTALNAFATGRDPAHAAVAITTGLRERLNRDELQGVLAHEISHVRNFDIRFAMLLAVLVGFLVLLCDVFRRYLFWGGGRSRRRSSSGRGGGGAGIIIVLAVLLSIIAPILAKMIQFAASRQREYLADASAVELTRNPAGLAGALVKLGGDREVLEVANRATQHLYIVNPIKAFEKRAKGLFATHPPLEDRIERLRALIRESPGQSQQNGNQ